MIVKVKMCLPENCIMCPLGERYMNTNYCRVLKVFTRGKTKRPKGCPIVGGK